MVCDLVLIVLMTWLMTARLRAQDIDQEVKERAISCMGQIIAHLGRMEVEIKGQNCDSARSSLYLSLFLINT